MARVVKFLKGGPHFSPLGTLNQALIDGEAGVPTTTAVPVSTNSGHTIVFRGDFVISGGIVTGGTVTGFDVFYGSTKVMKARGYAVTVAALTDAFDAADMFDATPFHTLFFSNATLKGSDAEDHIFGRADSKVLGKDGNDQLAALEGIARLNGGDGGDVLLGNGMSKLTGGRGDDIFVFLDPAGGSDRVTDFVVKDDVVALHPTQFDDVPVGYLADAYFHIGKVAKTADHHVLYNRQTGALSWDDDGSGPMAQVQIGILPDHLKMKADNIFIAIFIADFI